MAVGTNPALEDSPAFQPSQASCSLDKAAYQDVGTDSRFLSHSVNLEQHNSAAVVVVLVSDDDALAAHEVPFGSSLFLKPYSLARTGFVADLEARRDCWKDIQMHLAAAYGPMLALHTGR